LERIAGRNSVREAIKAGRKLDKVLFAAGADLGDILELAESHHIHAQQVERQYLDTLVKERHQGVVAFAEAVKTFDVDDILEFAEARNEPPLIVALDGLEDPQNLGSILRSSDGLGAHGVIIPERRAAGLTTAVSRASAGAVEWVKVARVVNLARTLDELKKKGLWAIGLDGSGKDTLWDVELKSPTIIVVGGEGKGIGRLIREKCDIVARIPMLGKVSSFNAGVATALALYEARRQRTGLA
jgi:23S rRNA (guanosine2251-2'-O)-methyltransferase